MSLDVAMQIFFIEVSQEDNAGGKKEPELILPLLRVKILLVEVPKLGDAFGTDALGVI